MTSSSGINLGITSLKNNSFVGVPIKNNLGEQNCFLNVLIHLFYNIDEIKKFLLEEETKKEEKYGLLNALKEVLENYQTLQKDTRNEKVLDPYELRKELGDLFKDEKKFCLRKMEDPVEALIVIVNAFHSFYLGEKTLKTVVEKHCDEKCLAHRLFWINILQQDECKCGASSEVLKYDYNYFLYEAYVKEILNFCEKEQLKDINNQFLKYLKRINSQTSNVCPEKCSMNKVSKRLYLLNNPKYFIFNLTWDESNPLLEDICKLYFCLPTTFKNNDLYDVPKSNEIIEYEMYGLICYWGAHYVCYIKHQQDKFEFWENYDDTTIIKINDWCELMKKAIKSHLHPVVIVFKTKGNKKFTTEKRIPFSEQEEILRYCKKLDNEKKLKRNQAIEPTRSTAIDNNEFTLLRSSINEKYPIKNDTKESLNSTKENGVDQSKDSLSFKDSIDLKKSVSGEQWICDYCDNDKNDYLSFLCKKCKKVNENVKLIVHQQNYFKNNQNRYDSLIKSQIVNRICPRCNKNFYNDKCNCEINCDNANSHSKHKDQNKKYCPNPICKKELIISDKCIYCCSKIIDNKDILKDLEKKKKTCPSCRHQNYTDSKSCLNCGNSNEIYVDNNKTNSTFLSGSTQSTIYTKCRICDKNHGNEEKCIIYSKPSSIYCECLNTTNSNDSFCRKCYKSIKRNVEKMTKCLVCKIEMEENGNLVCLPCLKDKFRSRSQIPIKEKEKEVVKNSSPYSNSTCSICKKEINKQLGYCDCFKKNEDNRKSVINNPISHSNINNSDKYQNNLSNNKFVAPIVKNSNTIHQTPKNLNSDKNNTSFRNPTQNLQLNMNYQKQSPNIFGKKDEKKPVYLNTFKNEKSHLLENSQKTKIFTNTNSYSNTNNSLHTGNSSSAKINNSMIAGGRNTSLIIKKSKFKY